MALLATPSLAADDSQSERVHVVTYVELLPGQSDAGRTLLMAYRNAGRGEHGNLRLEALNEVGRPTRFALLETWDSKALLDAHESGPAAREFRTKFETIAATPPDERILSGVRVGEDESHPGSLYVLTHVDVAPQYADAATALLQTLFDATRKEDGNAAYAVLRQQNRPNHFTTVEQWKDEAAREKHAAAASAREFRQKLAPMMGALYDERIYHISGK